MKTLKDPGILLLLLFLFVKGYAQEPVFTFPGQFEMSSSDPLGNFYLIQEEQIVKVDSLGKVIFTFSDPGLGDITWVDTSDPFRILIYYRSFNQVIYLDRTLSSLGDPVFLDELEIFIPAGICRSSQGGFWVLDQTSSSLIHMDAELKQKVNIRLDGVAMDQPDNWFPMLERKERLYICRKGQDIFLFDLYGTHLKNIPAKASSISSHNNMLLFIGDQIIYLYNDFPAVLSEDKTNNFPHWELLNISKNRALVKGQSGWQLYQLKKTPSGT